jgi:hypothetical protein
MALMEAFLSTSQPNAAAHAVARGPERAARASAPEPAVEESLAAHANRVLRARLTAAVVCVLDPAIALLQWFRKAAGARDAEDGHGSKKDRPGGRPGDAALLAAETAAPAPRRRLRAFLVYVSVMLACGMGGGALAYELLEKLIIYGYSENGRLEAALTAQSRSAAAARQELEQAQAGRIDAEKKLAALRAEHAGAAARQDKLAQADTRSEAARAVNAQAPQPAGRQAPPPKTVDCGVVAGNDVSALMDCIHKFNR